ncbi:MAG: cytochrome-c oxidase, cbb3-type subunit I [Pseudobacteriovorax sp.]|nr:cytochrome-c oxidase, cbb3-type subunit I [Pseudobacteriovorax sp.]
MIFLGGVKQLANLANAGPEVYDDRAARLFLWATLLWGIVGMSVGALAALQLAFWPANGGISWLTFGRIRPIHTDAMVFAFAGNAVFAGMYYSLQRLCKKRLFSDFLTSLHFWGWQAIIAATAVTLALGMTQGKEYAEMEWPIDLAIAVIWVVMCINVFGTIAKRRVEHLYVAIWFYIASIITIAVLHIVNNLAIPVGAFKSYSIYSGVQDALVQWWYGHNAVGFLLTTPFLGIMYYFLPKAVDKPVYSYRLSILHFWALIFVYIWAGPHHLLYTSLPEWAQSLGMVFSLVLIAPSWGGMINGLLTMRGAWHKVREEPVLKFYVLALTFYGMATLEGPLLSIKSLNLLSHYTDWTIAHVHGGALGWLGGMVFGMAYWLAPKLWNTELYSKKLANMHFWIATIGLLLYVSSMWTAGITQGLMWMATTEEGLLKYPNFLETVLALIPLYWVRMIGGTMYLAGSVLCVYNIYKTAKAGQPVDIEVDTSNDRHVAPRTFHERLEGKAFPLTALALVAVLIGGIVEFVPAFLLETKVPTVTATTPYTPLELQGRDIYIREGCYNCHSQMVRTHHKEELRYGPHSKDYEFLYDFNFQWGSKRTGPDLHRVGKKYPDLWHYRHMLDPRLTSPGSIMPSYPWLFDSKVDTSLLAAKLNGLTKLGVPYKDSVLQDPVAAYNEQADVIVATLAAEGITATNDLEIIAMIAYLQKLGTERAPDEASH